MQCISFLTDRVRILYLQVLTEAEPFNLASTALHEGAQADFRGRSSTSSKSCCVYVPCQTLRHRANKYSDKMAMEKQEDQDNRQFKAQPIVHHFPEYHTQPAAERPLTEVCTPRLYHAVIHILYTI